jgi:hypothetical protein
VRGIARAGENSKGWGKQQGLRLPASTNRGPAAELHFRTTPSLMLYCNEGWENERKLEHLQTAKQTSLVLKLRRKSRR